MEDRHSVGGCDKKRGRELTRGPAVTPMTILIDNFLRRLAFAPSLLSQVYRDNIESTKPHNFMNEEAK